MRPSTQLHLSQHDYSSSLVTLSVVVATLASYTALDLSGRIQASAGRVRALWVGGGATAMGFGIWSMHFVGMLALHLPVAATYAIPQLLTSFAVAVGASAFALWVAGRARVGHRDLSGAAIAMGIAIAGMHYVGMSGMRISAHVEYDPALLAASIAIAIGASYVALFIARRLRDEESVRGRRLRAVAAVAMGFAIAGMHYTGMAAMRLAPIERVDAAADGGFPPFVLGLATALAGIVVAGLAITAAMLDRLVRSRIVEDRLRAEKTAAQATNRVKSEFLANMSHELRTPLNSIIGFANILLKNKDAALGERDMNYVSRIAKNSTHLLGLINGVLDVSKIEAGRMELRLTSVDVVQLVRETVAEFEPQAVAHEVLLIVDVGSRVSTLDADCVRLKQILINLIGNAVKFTRAASVTVRVLADPQSGEVTGIDVIDRGIGIPADRLEAIFEAFQQAVPTTSREYGGTGLGLTIARAMAELMGWTLVASSTLGVGSTFSLGISRKGPNVTTEAITPTGAPAATGDVITPAPTQPSPRRVRVLVIDDEEDARLILKHQLEELGCEVLTAVSCDEGMRLARSEKPDLITLDIMMPRKNGLEALLELKADHELRHIPVVMVSVVAGEHQRRLVGAMDWLEKPVTHEALRTLIARRVFAA
jgi:signal transduction histidine kinase/CheY-like chemotaxis protein